MTIGRKIIAHLYPLILCLGGTAAFALDADEMFADPEREARARDIGRQLRCVVCKNQSIFDSNAGIAQDLRNVVRERMDVGESDEAILEYIAARYGDFVLLKPRINGQTLVLWGAPFAFLLLGGGFLVAYHRKGRARTRSPELSDADREEAQKLLGLGAEE